MSYNITGTKILSGSLRIDVNDLLRLHARHRDQLPSSNFVATMAALFDRLEEKPREMPIADLAWRGDFSGIHWDFFLETVVPCLRGTADVLIIWESGDSIEGLRIEHGQVKNCAIGLVPR